MTTSIKKLILGDQGLLRCGGHSDLGLCLCAAPLIALEGWHRQVDRGSDEELAVLKLGGRPEAHRRQRSGERSGPSSRVKVHVTDWNGDGRPDLLVGDVQWERSERGKLSREERTAQADRKALAIRANRGDENALVMGNSN